MTVWTRRRMMAAVAALPAGRALAAKDRPEVALIGRGGRGIGVTRRFLEFGNLVALADVDATHLAKGPRLGPAPPRTTISGASWSRKTSTRRSR